MKPITVNYIKKLKNSTAPFATLTAYDFISAQILNEAKIPLILVGDSASMMIYGYDTTLPISMEEMLLIVKAVSRGSQYSLVVADMPFLSYQPSVEETIKNAGMFIKDGGASAVKLEGGTHMFDNIKSLVDIGVPVLGHVGLTPQSYHQLSGYSIQGKTSEDATRIIKDALSVEQAGAFGVVLECVPETLATEITKQLSVPTIGIGSGKTCDGQIQVLHDILGLQKKPPPKHAMIGGNLYNDILSKIETYKTTVEKL